MYKYLMFASTLFLFSCAEPTNEEIEKAFLEVNNEKLWIELQNMSDNDQYYRNIVSGLDKSDPNLKKIRDSLWALQEKVDNKNTKWMIDFTKKYGFPNPDRTGKPIGVWMIFHHAPKQYHKKIKPLLEREYKAGRIDQTSYGLVTWHLNGRKGLPKNTGLQIIDNRDN